MIGRHAVAADVIQRTKKNVTAASRFKTSETLSDKWRQRPEYRSSIFRHCLQSYNENLKTLTRTDVSPQKFAKNEIEDELTSLYDRDPNDE